MSGLVLAVAFHSPMPGELSAAHAQVSGLSWFWSCDQCHSAEGLAAGCLSCHGEIDAQLESREGYHAWLLDPQAVSCTPCHGEHRGSDHSLISEVSWQPDELESFDHPHVEFGLSHAHLDLQCDSCHASEPSAFVDDHPALLRQQTFLGKSQECDSCHRDPHDGGLEGSCEQCHEQEVFDPASLFDHDAEFPLIGGHQSVECAECHMLSPPGGTTPDSAHLLFQHVAGRTCAECHDSPHTTPWPDAESCQACHEANAETWSEATELMTLEEHSLTGFPLSEPHQLVECSGCHQPSLEYAQRYSSDGLVQQGAVKRAPDTCQACHEDVHRGQFANRHQGCLDCHDNQRFVPVAFGLEKHARSFPLTGVHGAVSCRTCHETSEDQGAQVRRFVGTPQDCIACHQSPHQVTMEGSCDTCHDSDEGGWWQAREAMTPQLHGSLGFSLEAPHEQVGCDACHDPSLPFQESHPSPVTADHQRSQDSCSACHEDPHAGQFTANHPRCLDCHDRLAFSPTSYERRDHLEFPLRGAHGRAECQSCHLVQAPDNVRVFVDTPRDCQACHQDPHGGQFDRELRSGDCNTCHSEATESFELSSFDHESATGYALGGAHARASCADCHQKHLTPSSSSPVRIWRGTSTSCASCHRDMHFGQFRQNGITRCESCHDDTTTWTGKQGCFFDHDQRTDLPLDGSHADLDCSACHPRVSGPTGGSFVQFKPMGSKCEDCHGLR